MDFDLELAAHCMDCFYLSSNIGSALTDLPGTVHYSCGQNYTQCRICALSGKSEKACLSAHRYGLKAAERFGGKYIYYCAMGLTCFTTPIIGEHGTVGQVTAGPFLMGDIQDYIVWDLRQVAADKPECLPQITGEVKNLPNIDLHRVNALAELLFMAVSVVNSVAESKRLLENEQSARIQGQISDYLFRIKQTEIPAPYPYRKEKLFLHALQKGDQRQASKLLNELLGHIMFESGGDMQQIQSRIHELLILIARTIIDSGGDPIYLDRLLRQYRQEMPQMKTMEELSFFLSKTVRSLISDPFSNNEARHSDMIYHAVQYLRLNYQKKLTLEEVARSVYVSPTYLSRIFKRESGISMVDFLNRIRIEKSKELLADGSLRLIEVALRSGFESQSYFNRMFRQNVGMTPQQYRKLLLEKQ